MRKGSPMTVAATPVRRGRALHARRDRVAFIDIPERSYLAVDGCERTGSQTFQNAIATLYPVAYALHFTLRKAGIQAPVGMVEGLYWFAPDDVMGDRTGGGTAASGPWSWRLMIAIPDEATEIDVEGAIRDAADRRNLPALSRLHVTRFREGTCVQMLHVGAYSMEQPTIERLQRAAVEAGYEVYGPHHEIYLNDPRQVGEDRAKTILRQPIRRAAGSADEGRFRDAPDARL